MNIYFDANYSKYLAHAINELEFTSHEIQALHIAEILGDGIEDEDVIRHVSQNNGILFTKDSDFKKVKIIVDCMKSHSIGLFYMKTPKKEVYWQTVVRLIRAYINCRVVILNKTIPYAYEIMPNSSLNILSL